MNESCNFLKTFFTELKTIPMMIVVTVHSGMETFAKVIKKNKHSQTCEYSNRHNSHSFLKKLFQEKIHV